MNDLLERPHFLRSKSAEKCGSDASKTEFRTSALLLPEGGKKKCECELRPTAGLAPEKCGEVRGTPFLWQRRRQLEAELGECVAALTAAEQAADPMLAAFGDAQAHLLALTTSGIRHDYQSVLLPAYEAWRIASHEAYPFKKRVREMELWHAAILKQLAEVNAEIDRPKRPHFLRSKSAEKCGDLFS